MLETTLHFWLLEFVHQSSNKNVTRLNQSHSTPPLNSVPMLVAQYRLLHNYPRNCMNTADKAHKPKSIAEIKIVNIRTLKLLSLPYTFTCPLLMLFRYTSNTLLHTVFWIRLTHNAPPNYRSVKRKLVMALPRFPVWGDTSRVITDEMQCTYFLSAPNLNKKPRCFCS